MTNLYNMMFSGKIPEVFYKHYNNRAMTTDITVANGKIDIFCKSFLTMLFRAFKSAPGENAKNIPIKIILTSKLGSNEFDFERIFYLKNKDYAFCSTLYVVKHGQLVEKQRSGICWHFSSRWDGEKVCLEHIKFSWHNIRIPLEILIGKVNAYEWVVNESSFKMRANLTHPFFGKLYEYTGTFNME